MSKLIRRHLISEVLSALQTSRIVNIVGPRQAGKSTLVQHQLPNAEYLTMDSDNIRNALQADAYAQLRSIADRHKASSLPIVLDEIQLVPELTLALKRIVDQDNKKGQFVLTGSADVFGLTAAADTYRYCGPSEFETRVERKFTAITSPGELDRADSLLYV